MLARTMYHFHQNRNSSVLYLLQQADPKEGADVLLGAVAIETLSHVLLIFAFIQTSHQAQFCIAVHVVAKAAAAGQARCQESLA